MKGKNKNWKEKGFTFPVTLCILMLFSIFLTTYINQYLIEKRYFVEVETFERNQFYFLQTLKKVEQHLEEETYEMIGTYAYERGTVQYMISEIEPNLLSIHLRLSTDTKKEATGIGYYDKELQRMFKWVERN